MKAALAKNENASAPSYAASIPLIGDAVSNIMATNAEQQFRHGASSLSEALLRAATGAGVNKDEAKQKIREITPVVGDSAATIKQKMDSIPLYIKSLEYRAGKKGATAAGTIVKNASDLFNAYGLTPRP
jgi:hypothetical protein